MNGIYDVRLRIAQATGVPSTNITVVSDHSHNGPDTIGIWGGVSAEYMKITADAAVKAAVQAWNSRRAAVIKVAAVNQEADAVSGVPRLETSYEVAPGWDPEHGNPYNEFRLLVADDAASGERILTFVNYAPHATVTNGDKFDGKYRLTGDWAAWAPQEAEALYGGTGLAAVGALGNTDWRKAGNVAQKEAEARARLRTLMATATAQLQPVSGASVQVESTFIHEPLTQPILLANYKPGVDHNRSDVPSDGFDVRIDRSVLPPYLTGSVVGTYVSAIRIGDVFISTFPGEPFGELNYALKDEGRVQGARVQFLLGGANDFFGYMVKKLETYEQTARTGALYLPGCPEQQAYEALGVDYEDACSDHWSLMVSPTLGSHIVCTLQDSADRLGFTSANRDPECAVMTALDGLGAPPESGNPVAGASLDARRAAVTQAYQLAEQCRGTAAPSQVCDALADGARTAETYLGAEPAPPGSGDVLPEQVKQLLNDPIDPLLFDCTGPAGDPAPGTPEFALRDAENTFCTQQRRLDMLSQPANIQYMSRNYGADPYRAAALHDGKRFRHDALTVAGAVADVYRPCAAGTCSNMPAGLQTFEPPYPVVIVLHGLASDKNHLQWASEPLAERGYFVVAVNGTGNTLPGAVLNWIHGAGQTAYPGQMDVSRVGITGHSLGAENSTRTQGDPRVSGIVAWDPCDDATGCTDSNGSRLHDKGAAAQTPTLFITADYSGFPGYPQPRTAVPGTLRVAGFKTLRDNGVDSMLVTTRATTHLDFAGAFTFGNRLNEAASLYYTLSWFDRYVNGKLEVDGSGSVVALHGRSAAEERAYRQAIADQAFNHLTASRFDGMVDLHNISEGYYDELKAMQSGDPEYGGNVPYRVDGLALADRLSFYHRSVCYISRPDLQNGNGAKGDPVLARADTTPEGDMRPTGCAAVQ